MSNKRFSELPAMRRASRGIGLSKLVRISALAALILSALTAAASINADRWLADVKYLASDQLKGRGDGTPELNEAADYIGNQFRQAGLKPVGSGTDYFQPFEAVVGSDMGPNNKLVMAGEPSLSYVLRQDYIPLSISSSGNFLAEVAFVGYGITAPEYHYDDYAGIDVKGKVVLVLRHEPQEDDENSVFMGKRFTRHAALIDKAINARNHGAVAMLFVNDPLHHSEDKLINFGEGGTQSMGVVVFQVKETIADQWLSRADHSLSELQKAIDKDLSDHSFALPPAVRLEVAGDVSVRKRTLKNVIGYLPGSDPRLRDQYIVIGAHYDHLGLGEYDSLAPDKIGQIHHGADDNASGTAGMMELARTLSTDPNRPRRSVLFMAYAGEELGLFGSAYYVDHPLIPLDKTIAMLNLDMIGRVKENRLFVGGVGTSPNFRHLVEEQNTNPFRLDFSDSGYDASDHMSFGRKGVPVLFFFSGLHADYHKPSDTWDKVEPAETAHLLEFVTRIVHKIDSTDDRPVYTKVEQDRRYRGADAPGDGYGPYFGSIPDFAETKGVKFADVKEGSPAQKAGLKPGDVLIEFDGKPIENLYDFTYALRAKNPGDEVKVVVMRGDEKVTAAVKLVAR